MIIPVEQFGDWIVLTLDRVPNREDQFPPYQIFLNATATGSATFFPGSASDSFENQPGRSNLFFTN